LPSLQFHLFKPLMRIARWSQGNFPVQDASAFVRFRQLADRMANFAMRPPRDVNVESESVGGVAGDWLIPANAPENPVMLFLHGGGIAFGWNNPLRRELAYLAKFAGLRAFGVDYHLIPEYLYPVAHDECYAVYRALLQQGKQIVMIGESSGALLALAILLRAKAVGLSQPLLCALISPVVDYGCARMAIRRSLRSS
jgi:monoterpene epsilon-lactone hydrolase